MLEVAGGYLHVGDTLGIHLCFKHHMYQRAIRTTPRYYYVIYTTIRYLDPTAVRKARLYTAVTILGGVVWQDASSRTCSRNNATRVTGRGILDAGRLCLVKREQACRLRGFGRGWLSGSHLQLNIRSRAWHAEPWRACSRRECSTDERKGKDTTRGGGLSKPCRTLLGTLLPETRFTYSLPWLRTTDAVVLVFVARSAAWVAVWANAEVRISLMKG
jgi:hypothetical protein